MCFAEDLAELAEDCGLLTEENCVGIKLLAIVCVKKIVATNREQNRM